MTLHYLIGGAETVLSLEEQREINLLLSFEFAVVGDNIIIGVCSRRRRLKLPLELEI